mgnify:CR=1 FL=1
MKRVYAIFAVTLAVMTCVKAYSQNGLSVFDKKGNINLFSIHQIDSITYNDGQEFFTQKIWKDGEPFETSVNEVREVSFLPKGNVYVFDDKTLGNWDGGFLIDSMYVSYKEDVENGGYYYFNNINAESNKGLAIQFDSDNKMRGILCNGLFYSISKDENQLLFLGIDDEGVFEESIVLNEVSSAKMARKRVSSESIPLFDNLLIIKDYWEYIQTASNLGVDFRDRQWIDFFKTIGKTAGAYGISKMLEGSAGSLGFLALAPFEMVAGSVEQSNKRNAAKIYGESSVEITEIRKSSDGRIEVYVTVNGANTIPDYLVRLIEPEKNEKTKNNVSCGVIGRSAGLPTLQLHTKGYESTEETIPTDGSVSTLYFTFFLPDVPLGQTYRFRPYLKSTRIKNIWCGVDECFIRYGNSVAYTGFNGKITNFWQYRAEYGIDAEGFGFVSFGTEVTAEISSLENVEEWGVYVYDLNGSGVNDRYPSEFRAAKLTDKIDIDFNINMDEFDEVNQNIYTKKVMLGVYQKMKNPTGTYDYLTYYYSEPQEYELVYEDKNQLIPIVTTGDCSNVTKNTATVYCTYENVPAGGVCGVEYTWNEGSVSKSIGSKEGIQEISLDGLKPGTVYTYCAYIEAYGQTYYGEEKTFTTNHEIPDIAGVWHCKEYQEGTQTGEGTFELKADGTVTRSNLKDSGSEVGTSAGRWSINSDGYVYIYFEYVSNSGASEKSYGGTINCFANPSQIEGKATYSYTGNMGGGTQKKYDFIMTR